MGGLLSACHSLGYYAHVGGGQLRLMGERRPIADVLDDPGIPAPRRQVLAELLEAREFASARLGLPRNGSYTDYVALDRPYVTWNVFAAPEFSVEPVTHCFPVAGCVAYRGYFTLEKARDEARRLQARGHQTWIGGTSAYSTLGWFDDPVLSSMIGPDQDDPVGTVFHELEHQQLYVRDDTAFNESIASFVQREGLREWRAWRGQPAPDEGREVRERAFVAMALALRARLADIYSRELSPEAMRAQREHAIAGFRDAYAARRRTEWAGDARFDRWVEEPITNAKLVPMGLYDGWVPAFAAVFDACGRQWACFHARTAALAREPAAVRQAGLDALVPGGIAPGADASLR
ncbi:aminopeptidase [Lysobacter aestuarii]|uniref:Aminopeptidase n=1 Tax=Marilutibacter aestuarii TaxID=1706195 RepID=A0A508A095_9GAMM|nr:aminopeptidase [Lysobacter aestuarii]